MRIHTKKFKNCTGDFKGWTESQQRALLKDLGRLGLNKVNHCALNGSGWELVTQAERWTEQYPNDDPRLFVAIAWLALEPGQDQRPYRVLFGTHDKIATDLVGASVYSYSFVSIALVLHALRINARNAGIQLPARLTVAEGEPGYDNWQAEIVAYQERAGARVAKIKPFAPA